MRYLWIVMCSTTLLMGCATTAEQKKSSLWQKWSKKDNTAEVEKVAAQSNSLLPAVDLSQQPGFTDQYRVGKFSVGAWVNQNPGQLFQKVTAWHPDAALLLDRIACGKLSLKYNASIGRNSFSKTEVVRF